MPTRTRRSRRPTRSCRPTGCTFPEGRRLQLTLRDAQFTSSDGDSHVMSLGEFAALYLSVWSPALWGTEVVRRPFAADATSSRQAQPFRWDQELPPYVEGKPEEGAIVMPPIHFPKRVAGHLYVAPKGEPEAAEERGRQARGRCAEQFAILQEFHRNLPKVQRALANVPTYMIFDDHDVTDDYFLNPVWRDRVLTTSSGRRSCGNGMIAYALFQDWGNDPVAYESGPKAAAARAGPAALPDRPDQGAGSAGRSQQIAALLGHDQPLTQTPDGNFLSVNPAAQVALHDRRAEAPRRRASTTAPGAATRSQAGPPGNVSVDAMVDQLPLPPLPAGREILIVVAPLQVIGPPVLDEIVAPLSYRVFDAVQAKSTSSLLDPSSTPGLRQMTGTNPDAIEAWAFDAETFEHLLERLEPYGRVVLLSGDVHYSSGTLMSYWRGNATRPARFAQFTSSGFKNVMPAFITFLDRAAGFAQQLMRPNLGTERLGWDQPLDDLVLLPDGATEQRPACR